MFSGRFLDYFEADFGCVFWLKFGLFRGCFQVVSDRFSDLFGIGFWTVFASILVVVLCCFWGDYSWAFWPLIPVVFLVVDGWFMVSFDFFSWLDFEAIFNGDSTVVFG